MSEPIRLVRMKAGYDMRVAAQVSIGACSDSACDCESVLIRLVADDGSIIGVAPLGAGQALRIAERLIDAADIARSKCRGKGAMSQ